MANTQVNLEILRIGKGGDHMHLAVDGGSHLFKGSLISQLTATGMAVPGTTANSGHAKGVAVHEQDATDDADAVKKVRVETNRDFVFANDGTNPFSGDEAIGAIAYMTDDHTVATTGTVAAGTFQGLDPEGVRVKVTTDIEQLMLGLTEPEGA